METQQVPKKLLNQYSREQIRKFWIIHNDYKEESLLILWSTPSRLKLTASRSILVPLLPTDNGKSQTQVGFRNSEYFFNQRITFSFLVLPQLFSQPNPEKSTFFSISPSRLSWIACFPTTQSAFWLKLINQNTIGFKFSRRPIASIFSCSSCRLHQLVRIYSWIYHLKKAMLL